MKYEKNKSMKKIRFEKIRFEKIKDKSSSPPQRRGSPRLTAAARDKAAVKAAISRLP
jgi:hypothetical protein